MKPFQQVVIKLIVGAGLVVFGHAGFASESDKGVALGLLDKGLQHCTSAMKLSRTDQSIAKSEYDLYALALSRAVAIYPEISSESTKISRQVDQCAQVGDDIARAQALPFLEQGVAACKQAKSLAKGDYLSKAKTKYREYVGLRDKALLLTQSVLKVGSNSSKVRRCDKLEGSLMAAETRIEGEEADAAELISLLQKSADSCQVAQRMVTQSGVSRSKLDATKTVLYHAETYFQETELHSGAMKRAKNYPGYASSKKVKEITLQYSNCHDELVAVISAATQSVIRQEEFAKIKEQEKIDRAVEQAVAKAKAQAILDMNKQAEIASIAEAKKVEKVTGDQNQSESQNQSQHEGGVAVSESTVAVTAPVLAPESVVEAETQVAQELGESSTSRKVKAGKGAGRVRNEVVQVSKPW